MINAKILRTLKRGWKDEITHLFQQVYDKYYKLVFFVAFSYLKEEQSSEDIVQDVFITFFEKCTDTKRISQISNTKAYLCSCAKNAAIKEAKARKKYKEIDNPDLLFSTEKESLLEPILHLALKDIDEGSLSIINDHIFLDLSFKEIAERKK